MRQAGNARADEVFCLLDGCAPRQRGSGLSSTHHVEQWPLGMRNPLLESVSLSMLSTGKGALAATGENQPEHFLPAFSKLFPVGQVSPCLSDQLGTFLQGRVNYLISRFRFQNFQRRPVSVSSSAWDTEELVPCDRTVAGPFLVNGQNT